MPTSAERSHKPLLPKGVTKKRFIVHINHVDS